MIETIGEVAKGVEDPTSYEIYKYLDLEVEDIKAYVSTFECIWDEYGCTLMHYTKKYDKLLNLLQSRDCFFLINKRFWQGEECGVPISVDGQHGGGDRRKKNRPSGNRQCSGFQVGGPKINGEKGTLVLGSLLRTALI
ncbi:hypothetical protein Taro_004615 [Colocasia esculenta]|uniref:Uncharacterized protein n=1 Tax=Colocasia esculenta TaxID=4460 RepID=A0A843TVE5_COLES|nr:hypothetical protein [Colocasia esculenta]